MRKVKVAAAIVCLLSAGALRGVVFNNSGVSVAKTDESGQIREIAAATVTTTASIETTTIVTTTTRSKTTAARKKAAVTTTTTATSAPATTTAVTTTVTEATTAATVLTSAPETTFTLPASVPAETAGVVSDAAPAAPSTQTETPATTVTETVPEVTAPASAAITVTDREYCMLCNVVGHEYGADWVPIEEKALVCEVIMNRVNSPQFPDSIYEVLTQRNQFAGLNYLIEMDGMSSYVTDSVKAAVDLYLSDPTQFNHGYLFFNGDGRRNYFRTAY
ncbi:MAG: cell wall hydrolase [Oscillospiraceae bacterium]|nr:cell wall hydrolase [Oscillospiraceae bacterium]MCR4761360.1 cell wall hydrolase [Oscillospiraceae bacterium]